MQDENKATLFAMAADLMLSDGSMDAMEKEVLDYISSVINISIGIKEKIIDVVLIKNKGNRMI